MSLPRKTIFDLERRCNLNSEYQILLSDLRETLVTSSAIRRMKLYSLLDESIKTWPYRQAAISISSYAYNHGFYIDDAQDDEELLFNIELIINLLHWAPHYESQCADPYDMDWEMTSTVSGNCDRCLENISFFLEQINMRIRKKDMEPSPQYYISKRDAQVDAVIEAVPELSEALLSYLDVRNQNDENAKESVLKAIADYLEQKRKDKYYKGTEYYSLSENIFTVFNNASIRHKNDQQWKLRKPVKMKLYDQTFKAAIHLLQMEDVRAFNAMVEELKESQEAAIQKPKKT